MCNHRVPINKGQIKELQRFALEPLQPPRHIPFETVIALDSAAQCVMGARGALQRLSPPEPAFAVILSIRDAIIQEAGDDALGKWRHTPMTASFRFELVTSRDDRYWRAQNLRQEAIEMGIVSQLSVRQWIYDVVGFKASREMDLGRELGSAQVAKYYHEKMKYTRGTEGASASFVDSALTVRRRALSNETARQWLEWCDEHLMEKSPWSKSIDALQALVDRAQATSRITWAICGLTDLYRMDSITAGEFTISRMQDYRQSYIEVINLKHAMRDELLQTWLPGIGLPIEHVKKMQEAFADFPNARASVTGYPDEPTVDTTWMVGWPPSSVAACTFPEECIYTCSYDGRYRDAVKSKAKVADILEHESVKREIDEIAATLAQTRAAAAAARGETPAVDPATPAPTTGTTTATPESKGFHSMEQQDQEHWEKIIKKHVHTHVDIIVEKKTAAGLENAIRDSTLAGIRGDPTGLVLFHFDVKQSGEPLPRPELRVAPLRDANYHRLVRTVLNARAPAGGTPGLRSGEVAILLDGGRSGNSNKLIAPWREGTSKDKKKQDDDDEDEEDKEDDPDDQDGTEVLTFTSSVINIVYSEAGIANRRKKLRSCTGGLHQAECAHMLSHTKVPLPERSRKHYPGSTPGDTIMGNEATEAENEWTMSWSDKKALHGKKNLIAVGGKTKGASLGDVVERKTDSTQLIHTFFFKAIVDLTLLDAKFAWQAVLDRVGYVGIAFTEEHKTMIYARLVEQMKTEMCQTGSKLYNAQYAKAAGLTETPPPVPPPNLKRRPRRKPVAVPTAEPGTGGDGEPENDNPEPEDDGLVGDPDPENAWDPFA
ncbi:unnamed protein product [Prorocentrum cordatum]|uniref:Uncharacterized protein n=1 Tax=Prorocentrum cordatum TaxID=2364126 RepID=A0ABN9RYW3_9DINO|nr:unnamed protein product [Polarella glacialis]